MSTTRAAAPQATLPRHHLLLVILVLLSFGLHMWRLDAKGLWWDESLSLQRAQSSLQRVLQNRIDFPGANTTDQHPPLYFVVLHAVTRIAGESDMTLRFPSVAFGALLVPLLYALGTRLRNCRTGLIAATAGALSPFYLWYAQEARMYTMLAALAVASVYMLWRALSGPRWPWAAGYLVTALAATATQYLFGLILVFQVLLAVVLWPRASRDARWRPALWVVVVVPLAAIGIVGSLVWRIAPYLGSNRFYVPLDVMLRDALNSFTLGLSVNPADAWGLVLVSLGVYAIGLVSIWDRRLPLGNKPPRLALLVLLLGWILIPIVGMWAFSFVAPVYMGSRYVIICSPAFYLGLAFGLDAIARRVRIVAPILGVLLVAGASLSSYRYFTAEEYAAKENYRDAARLIAKMECVGDAILVNGVESVTAFQHYYWGDLPVIGVPPVGMADEQVTEQLTALAKDYERLWLVEGNREISDEDARVVGWLDENALLLTDKTYAGSVYHVVVTRYLTQWPVQDAPSATARGVFEDRLALLDYDVQYFDHAQRPLTLGADALRSPSSEATDRPIPSGNILSLRMVSQPLAPLEEYRTSLRLLDASGAQVTQRDETPFSYLPTTEWPVGKAIYHQTYLRIPEGLPQGTYSLQLVLYRMADGYPLAYVEGEQQPEHAMQLGSVTVGAWRQKAPEHTALSGDGRVIWPATRFGTLELVGVDDMPDEVQPGATIRPVLMWRPQDDTRSDYRITLQWRSANGVSGETAPAPVPALDAVRPGELVRQVVPITLPQDLPAGSVTLHLAVQVAEDGPFAPIRRAGLPWPRDTLRIATIPAE